MTNPTTERAPPHMSACVLALLLCTGATVHASSCGDLCELYARLLLVSEQELMANIPQLERVSKPTAGPRNTRGHWIQRGTYVGTEAFDSTFYLKDGLVLRIELVSTAPQAQCRTGTPWGATVAALQTWHGQGAVKGEFNTGSRTQQSAHWGVGETDVSVYRFVTSTTCATTIAFKKRELKDASEL